MVSAGIILDGVELRRGGKRILGPVSISLAATGLTILIGPNGSGKTSLLRALHGLERISRGRVIWPDDGSHARQAFVFQSPILMRRTVVDCIAYPLLLDGVPKVAARAKAVGMATHAGLGARLTLAAQDLSGGERQKLALARAMIRDPRVLFLDEPCANLDGSSTREIETVLHKAVADGTRVIMSTHDLGQARRLASDVLFLHEGSLVETATTGAFFNSPQSPQAAAYLNGELL